MFTFCREINMRKLLRRLCKYGLKVSPALLIFIASQSIAQIEKFTIESEIVKQAYDIRVYLPPEAANKNSKLPVLYVTDGAWFIDTFPGAAYTLRQKGIPPFIIVGIDYHGDYSPSKRLALRFRDLLIWPDEKINYLYKYYNKDGVLDTVPNVGKGAPKFLDFIREELIPLVERKYPANPNDRAYFGYSGGGHLGLYTLFTKPDTFNRYIVADGWYGDDIIGRAKKYLKSNQNIDAKLFFSVALDGAIQGGGKVQRPNMLPGFYDLAKFFYEANIPDLKFYYKAYPDEVHLSLWLPSYLEGMRAVFLPPGCKPYLWPDGVCPERN